MAAATERGFLREAWDLAWPYWKSEEKWSAIGLLAAIIALNLFAVGFPITLVFGFVIVLFALPGIQMVVVDLVNSAFGFMGTILGSG